MKTNIFIKFENIFNGLKSLIFPMRKGRLLAPASSQSPTANVASRNFKKMATTKDRSMSDSQGNSKFSGSSYNSPGNVSSGKKRYNKSRR